MQFHKRAIQCLPSTLQIFSEPPEGTVSDSHFERILLVVPLASSLQYHHMTHAILKDKDTTLFELV